MKVKKLEKLGNKIDSTGCKWSSFCADSDAANVKEGAPAASELKYKTTLTTWPSHTDDEDEAYTTDVDEENTAYNYHRFACYKSGVSDWAADDVRDKEHRGT